MNLKEMEKGLSGHSVLSGLELYWQASMVSQEWLKSQSPIEIFRFNFFYLLEMKSYVARIA